MVQRVSRGVASGKEAVKKLVKEGVMVKAVQTPTTEKLDITGTVSVACNCPSGLILRKHIQIPNRNPRGPNGEEPPMMWVPDPKSKPVRVRGPSIGRGGDAGPVRFAIAGGYAITRNVPRDVWEAWLEQNKDSTLVENRMIFACKTESEAEQKALKADTKSGYEPLDPTAAPKEMRTGRGKHLKMEAADELAD